MIHREVRIIDADTFVSKKATLMRSKSIDVNLISSYV